MAHAYTPGLQVFEKTIVSKTRTLPLKGEVMVKVGDKVTSEQYVARTELPNEVQSINIANLLSIEPVDIHSYMLKKEGEAIKQGEAIAENKPMFGIKLFQKTIPSPIDGTIENISTITGQVLLRMPPRHVELSAYLSGTVTEIEDGFGVTIQNQATYIQGIFGIGGEQNGELLVLGDSPSEHLTDKMITPDMKGKIIVGGSYVDGPTLKKANELGISGIIVGGIDAEVIKDWLGYEIGVAITGDEDVTTTLIITEGFGKIPMAQRTYELLKKSHSQKASITGRTQIRAGVMRPEVIIPLAEGADNMVKDTDVSDISGIVIGNTVRIIREPHFGELGEITSLPSELVNIETEAKVRVLEVKLKDGTLAVLPRANVEIIEGLNR